ncbi:MAG: 4-alpha-glucanotransferase, partial [Dehalococcoidia bacterium]|nr:4-alpha-glucanotransferase [Dehalococcoidia bacterium]
MIPQTMQSTDSLRASGILLHPTSLPGPYGIGDLGPEAYRFVNFLEETGQTLWQILPVNPPGFENSPYMCFSAFAMNPLLISPDGLVTEGLLEPGDTRNLPQFNPECVDYGSVINFKMPLLEKSFALFQKRLIDVGVEDYHDFCRRNASWLEDFALFMALKRANGGTVWTKWEKDLAERTSQKLVEWRNKMDEEIHFHKYLQYLVFKQWDSLKNYCHNKGVRIIGDLPIYVAHDSADVWVNRKLFSLDEKGDPLVVAGVPPDYYSRTGQYWGNPIYNWEEMAKSGYGWWIDRMRLNYSLFDIIRLDHFRGFESYWEIPAKETAAITGRWKKGPGASLFNAIRNALGDIHVIAEDLGFITPEVDALRDHLGFPGM